MIPHILGMHSGRAELGSADIWTVFLVEDDLDDQRMAARILSRSPHIGKIICISNSDLLFDRLEKQKYFTSIYGEEKVLILLDIHMPGIDGLSLLEQLKSNPYTSDFPIIVITGDQKPEKAYESYTREANSFINKPLTNRHLEDIHAVLKYGNGWHRPSNENLRPFSQFQTSSF